MVRTASLLPFPLGALGSHFVQQILSIVAFSSRVIALVWGTVRKCCIVTFSVGPLWLLFGGHDGLVSSPRTEEFFPGFHGSDLFAVSGLLTTFWFFVYRSIDRSRFWFDLLVNSMYRISYASSIVSHHGVGAGRQTHATVVATRRGCRRWFSDVEKTSSNTPKSFPTKSTSGPMEFKNAAEKHEYLAAANAEMERYHNARELFRQGKLKAKNHHHHHSAGGRGTTTSESSHLHTGMVQLGVVTLFLVAFMATPLLGKRIAQDDDFRQKWIPSWYDFTVPKPEKPWTREELHEQMIAVQREIRERAIRGDFSPEKLQELQKNLEGVGGGGGNQQYAAHRASLAPSQIRKEWARIHPGVEDGEEVNEA